MTQTAPLLPPTHQLNAESRPVSFLCCSFGSEWTGLIDDCRPLKPHTPIDRRPVQPWTLGPDHTRHTPPTNTLTLDPTRLQHSTLKLITALRVITGFLLSVDLPLRNPPAASRLPGNGTHGFTCTPAVPSGFTIHEPCNALQLAVPRVPRVLRDPPSLESAFATPGFPSAHLDEAVLNVVVAVLVVAILVVVALVYWLSGFSPLQELPQGEILSAWCSTTPTRPAPGDDWIILSFLLLHAFTSRVYHRAP